MHLNPTLSLVILLSYQKFDGAQSRQNEFGIRVNQHPASVDNNASVWLECEFPLHNENLLSVIWYKGYEEVYAQTLSRNTGPPEYEDIVDEDESKMELSLEGMAEWSKSILKLHVTYCEAGDYTCLVTDTDTLQAEITHSLKFKEPTVELDATVNGTAICGSSDKFNISVGQIITLTGLYKAAVHPVDNRFMVEPSGGSDLQQGNTTHIPADGSCEYAGETSGGSLRFSEAGDYEVMYVISINGNNHSESLSFIVIEPTVELEATVNGTVISGLSNKMNISMGQIITLTGRYKAAVQPVDNRFLVEPSGGNILQQGNTTHIPADGSCEYTGETSGGSLRFSEAGDYDVMYVISINGKNHSESLSLTVIDVQGEEEDDERQDIPAEEEGDGGQEMDHDRRVDGGHGNGATVDRGIRPTYILTVIVTWMIIALGCH